jgi:hypothetical protein
MGRDVVVCCAYTLLAILHQEQFVLKARIRMFSENGSLLHYVIARYAHAPIPSGDSSYSHKLYIYLLLMEWEVWHD